MNYFRKISIAIKRPDILVRYARWRLSEIQGRTPTLSMNGYILQGFSNFHAYLGAWNYRIDDDERQFIRDATRNARIIIDVGANYGSFSILMARAAKQAALYAFEPVPATFTALEQNLKNNDVTNVLAIKCAVGGETGTVGFTDTSDPATNRMNRGFDARIQVPITTLDTFMEEHDIKNVDFLKVDVEGFEMEVLEGGRAAFAQGRVSKGLIEICPGNHNTSWGSCVSLFDFFEEHGYDLFWLDKPRLPLGRQDLEALGPSVLANAGFSKRLPT